MKINSEIFSAFKESILKFMRPSSNSTFDCHSLNGIKLIIMLTLGISHLRELSTNFRILLIQFAGVALKSRLLFITFFIVSIFLMKEGHSWTTFELFEKTFMIKMISESQNYFYLTFLQTMMHQIHIFCSTFLQIIMHQIHVFWMLPSNTYLFLKDLMSLILTVESFERSTFLNTYAKTTVSNDNSHKI